MGVEVPPAVKDVAAEAAARVRAAAPEARWVPRENYHVTVKFLGEVSADAVAEVAHVLGHAVEGLVDFPARTAELGAFPTATRARVLWLGLDDPVGGFAVLFEAVEEALSGRGFPKEIRAFAAHLTLARLRNPAPVSLPEDAVGKVVFTVDRLTLFRSHLGRPAPLYEGLVTFPFRRPAP